MGEVGRIARQMERAFDTESWTGVSTRGLLADVDAARARARPVPGAHSIWEIVLHLTAWARIAEERLRGREWHRAAPEEDWPAVPEDAGDEAWGSARTALFDTYARLRATTEAMAEEELGDEVPGGNQDKYVLLHGVIQHDQYHLGQIGLLKKALA